MRFSNICSVGVGTAATLAFWEDFTLPRLFEYTLPYVRSLSSSHEPCYVSYSLSVPVESAEEVSRGDLGASIRNDIVRSFLDFFL